MGRGLYGPSVRKLRKWGAAVPISVGGAGSPSNTGPRKHVLCGVHTGASWRIPLSCPYAAAMQTFCHITLTTCLISDCTL